MVPRLGHCRLYRLLLCLWSLNAINALSNLDISEPIVRISPASGDDNFGFAVVLHQVVEPIPGDFDSFINSTKIIIGAPQGTYPGGLDLPELMPLPRTGLVYLCPLQAPGSCVGLGDTTANINETNNDRRLFDGDPNADVPADAFGFRFGDAENKTMQLMGSVLASSGDLFVACAPRWVILPLPSTYLDNSRPVGRCFYSSRELQDFSLIRPCGGRQSLNPQQTLNANNQCLTGFSAAIISQNEASTDSGIVVLSVMGDALFNGNLKYYNAGTGNMIDQTSNVGSSILSNLYEGYSTTVGFITDSNFPDVISGVPRFDGNTLKGSVRIRPQSNLSGETVIANITGLQTGEYFGYSVAAADLNGDGFDELIVGAPIYSSSNVQESGRIYIYENTRGNLNPTALIRSGGDRPLARFGTSVVSLGDINGDSYEDIAVGSPYEAIDGSNNTGAVYVYYGAPSADGLVSLSADQVIYAQNVVDMVPVVTSLRSFGFSLFSGVDVDGNQFNDLLVGAYESRTTVLIRSFSVASVSVDLMTDTGGMVQIDTTGTAGSMFTLTVCASYSGRGLDGRSLDALIEVFETVSGGIPRLFFQRDDLSVNRMRSNFTFATTSVLSCMDVPVFVKPISQVKEVDLITPLGVQVIFPPLTIREPVFVGGNPKNLIDYRTIPILLVEGNDSVSVGQSVGCSVNPITGQEVCMPDLTVSLLNITFVDSQNNTIPGMSAVAGDVQTVNIYLLYNNIGEDPAFGSAIQFTLPERYRYVRVQVPPEVSAIDCAIVSSDEYNCDLPNYIPPGTNGTTITLIWRLTDQFLVGNEEEDTSNVSIILTSPRDVEINVTNNNLIGGPIRIMYSAVTNLGFSSFQFTVNPATYMGMLPLLDSASATRRVDQIGQRVQLTLVAVNRGPSLSSNLVIKIYIPTNDNDDDSYYLYLFEIEIDRSDLPGGSIDCDASALNPEELPAPPTNKKRKRYARRVRGQRQAEQDAIPASQTLKTEEIRNCTTRMGRDTSCSVITCTAMNFPRSVTATIIVSAFLDERFFQSRRDSFVFEGFATIETADAFASDRNGTDNEISTPPYRVSLFTEPNTSSFPIWIPIVCGIVAVILIIIIFIVLYFVGFFRRKKREGEDSKEAEGDFPVPPEAAGSATKPALSGEAVEPSQAEDDIGSTDDLEDSDKAEKPALNPEETSL